MIGDQIKKQREKKGLSQDKLAELMGISRPTLGKIEKNKKIVDKDMLISAANALDVDARILAAGELIQTEVLFDGSVEQIKQATDVILQETERLKKLQNEYDKSFAEQKKSRIKKVLLAVFFSLITLEIILLIIYHFSNR